MASLLRFEMGVAYIFRTILVSPMKIDAHSTLSSDFSQVGSAFNQPVTVVTTPVIAQQFEDNFFEHSGDILGNFVESGQLWALLIGIAIGYVIRGVTTY